MLNAYISQTRIGRGKQNLMNEEYTAPTLACNNECIQQLYIRSSHRYKSITHIYHAQCVYHCFLEFMHHASIMLPTRTFHSGQSGQYYFAIHTQTLQIYRHFPYQLISSPLTHSLSLVLCLCIYLCIFQCVAGWRRFATVVLAATQHCCTMRRF